MRREASSAGRGVLFLESGDFLFPEDALFPAEIEQRRAKADLILAATKQMGVDFIGIGDQDLRLGVEFLKDAAAKAELPVHCANLVKTDGTPVFPGRAIRTIGGVKVGLFSVMTPEADGKPVFENNPNYRLDDPFAAAEREVKALKAEGAQAIVAVTHLGVNEDMRLAKQVPGIHFVFGAHSASMLSEPNKSDATFVLQAGSRGKYLGRLDLELKGELPAAFATLTDTSAVERVRERIKHYESEVQTLRARLDVEKDVDRRTMIKDQVDFYTEQLAIESKSLPSGIESASSIQNELVPLSREIPDEPKVAKLVQATLDKIAEMPPPALLAVEDEAVKAPESSPYVGSSVCQACHIPQWNQWRTTGHAKAYKTLQQETHALDFDCVGCHTTGYRKEGGPKDPFQVAGFQNVQCEACHGPGRAHAKEPKKVKLAKTFDEGFCRSCHSVEQTGDRFVFADYLPKVAHPNAPAN